jgi:endonuclease/exonuclease/phosphatase family metal-dependent hydrolase
MKVMSFNIWSDAPRNSSWTKRRDGIAGVLRRDDLDVVGLQEATMPMIRDLHERLPEYEWVGAGRDDGDQQGECTPILFRADRFTVAGHGHFWLAENCDLPGRGWDAACCRIATWAQLEDRESGRRLAHFNTHFDHFGRRARVQSAHLLLRKIKEIGGIDPVILTGDFNCRDTSAPYFVLTGRPPFGGQFCSADGLRDTRDDADQPPEGPRKTYRGLLGLLGLGRIDYIFVKNGLRTRKYAVLDEGRGASDHRPVMAEVWFGERRIGVGADKGR